MYKILIVEDEEDEAKAIKEILENNGFKAETAPDVDKALVKIKRNKYDLILLDIILPLKLGNELLKTMKDEKINIPVIVVTAISDKLTGVKKDLLAINRKIGFIEKPFTSKQLLSHVQKFLK